jgi:hypothetical protein
MFNNAAWKMIKNAFKQSDCIYVAIYYTQVLKQHMKHTQVKGIYLTKDQLLQRIVNWLVKDQEVRDWLCDWWVSEDIRAVSKWNR